MATSITAMRSRFSEPFILVGRSMDLTATARPRHRPRYTLPNCVQGDGKCVWQSREGGCEEGK